MPYDEHWLPEKPLTAAAKPTDAELAAAVRGAYSVLRGHIRTAVEAGLKVTFYAEVQSELESPARAARRIEITRAL